MTLLMASDRPDLLSLLQIRSRGGLCSTGFCLPAAWSWAGQIQGLGLGAAQQAGMMQAKILGQWGRCWWLLWPCPLGTPHMPRLNIYRREKLKPHRDGVQKTGIVHHDE